MKIIKYNLKTMVNHGSEKEPEWFELVTPVELDWNEANERIAMLEAADGIYQIVDNGIAEEPKRSQEERITELEEALEMLLSGATE